MNKEEKELLIKDLCGRLPYGVKVNEDIQGNFTLIGLTKERVFTTCEVEGCHNDFPIERIKPYLFPLSSMTEEQFNEMHNYCYNAEREASKFSNGELKIIYNYELIKFDYLNRNHFDYRGLIPKGLANDATGLNIY